MKPTAPRFTLRWLMLAVAVSAAYLWGEQRMRRASAAYRERAEAYRFSFKDREKFQAPHHSTAAQQAAARAQFESRQRRRESYWEAMRIKYQRAARYPWLPVESDPPEPE